MLCNIYIHDQEPESQQWGWLSRSPAVPSARRQRQSVETEAVKWCRGGVAGVGEASRRLQRPSLDRVRVRMSVG
jgi:hypothetical protein